MKAKARTHWIVRTPEGVLHHVTTAGGELEDVRAVFTGGADDLDFQRLDLTQKPGTLTELFRDALPERGENDK